MSDVEHIGAAFTDLISTTVGAPVSLRVPPVRLSGGFWASIWAVDLADGAPAPFDGPLVVRVMPDRGAGLREAVVQETIANAGFRTPRVLLSGAANGLGEAYVVMERVNGRTPLGGLKLGPELFGLPKLLRALPGMLAATATALHAIDPSNLRGALAEAGFDRAPTSNPFRSIIDTAVLECPTAGFTEFVEWLDTHTPTPGPDVICHGDLHPLNLLVDSDRATWLLDWTTAAIAPREMDVGLTAGLLRCAPMETPRPLRPGVAWITNRLAEAFIRSVDTATPVDRRAVDWWEALQHGRCLAELAHGRLHADGVVGPGHPFETTAVAMQKRLRQLTGITITPPLRATDVLASPSGGR